MAQPTFDLFAMTAPGCEKACLAELQALGIAGQIMGGGVSFRGDAGVLYQANLWLRSSGRILVRFAHLRATSFPDLFQKSLRLPWGRFIRPQMPLDVRVTSRRSRLMHTDRIAETVRAAVDRALGRQEVLPHEGAQRLLVRLEDDQVVISFDSSGALLHRRGYRLEQGAAPLRETLAAALLHELDWQPAIPLWDPMCGSGTLLIEAALLGLGRAPGLNRSFAFENWPHFRTGRWELLCQAARAAERRDIPLSLHGSEIDSELLVAAQRNAERAGVSSHVNLIPGNFLHMPVPERSGILVCNPPYGLRLGTRHDLLKFYAQFGAFLRQHARGWRGGFLLPDSRLAEATGLNLRQGAVFAHGGLSVPLYLFQLT